MNLKFVGKTQYEGSWGGLVARTLQKQNKVTMDIQQSQSVHSPGCQCYFTYIASYLFLLFSHVLSSPGAPLSWQHYNVGSNKVSVPHKSLGPHPWKLAHICLSSFHRLLSRRKWKILWQSIS